MKKFPEINTARVLTDEEMQKFQGGATPCKSGCQQSCHSSCSQSCSPGNISGTIEIEKPSSIKK